MSFLKLLQDAREKHQVNDVEIVKQAMVDIPVNEEDQTDVNVDIPLCIGDEIIKQSAESLKKYRRLKGPIGSARRVAKAIATRNIKLSQLEKAFELQKRFGQRRCEFHVVGSYALQQLKQKLDDGIALNQALNLPYERKNDE